MGQPDKSQKKLEDFTDVFTDIVNTLAFHGEPLLKEDAIVAAPTESIYKAENGKLKNQTRDVLKYDKKYDTLFSIIGLENQSAIDQDMIFRVLGYDYAAYRSQIDSNQKKRRPVFTLVLYFGLTPWTAPKNLIHAVDTSDIPYAKYIPELLPEYKINVYEIAFLPKEVRQKFTSDFRIIADYFCAKREKNFEALYQDNREFKHVEEMLDFLSIFGQDKNYEKINQSLLEMVQKGESVAMCTVLQDAIQKGKREGILEGILEGKREGILEGKREGEISGTEKIIVQILKKTKNIAQTAELTDQPEKEIQRIAEKYQVI